MSIALDIRPAAHADLPALRRDLRLWGPLDHHDNQLAAQEAGRTLWLIAWEGPRPLGHLQVSWAGSRRAEVRASITGCPHLSEIGVCPERRSQGVGAALIAAAEGSIRARGFARAGLTVSLENTRARTLYERLGYRDWGAGAFEIAWQEHDEAGAPAGLVRELCTYLVKAL